MNWRDLKPGDRVRVTFEASVSFACQSSINLTLDPADNEAETSFIDVEADAATWELLPKPLRVGLAKFKTSGVLCDVLALYGEWAWVKCSNSGGVRTSLAENLVNIDEEIQP